MFNSEIKYFFKILLKEFWIFFFIYFLFTMDRIELNTLSLISIIQFIISIILFKICGYSFLSFVVLFEFFSFLFHCGQVVLEFFSIEAERPFDIFYLVDDAILKKMLCFYICIQFVMVIVITLIPLKKKRKILKNHKLKDSLENLELKNIYRTGLILFIIGFFPRIYIDFYQVFLFLKGGYLATYKLIVNSYIQVIAYCFQIGIITMLIGVKYNYKKARNIILFATVYFGVMMLKGGRATQVLLLLSLYYVYFKILCRINLRKILMFSLFGYFGIVFLSVIGGIRNGGLSEYKNFISLLIESFKIQALWDSLGEFGGTAISVCYSIKYFSSYAYGLPYLTSLVLIFPNIGKIYSFLQKTWVYIDNFPPSVRYALGGSYIGELYYNFGFFGGILASAFIGYILGVYSKMLEKSIYEEKWTRFSILMIPFSSILLWIRGYFSDGVRQVVWIMSLFFLIHTYIKNRNRRLNLKK